MSKPFQSLLDSPPTSPTLVQDLLIDFELPSLPPITLIDAQDDLDHQAIDELAAKRTKSKVKPQAKQSKAKGNKVNFRDRSVEVDWTKPSLIKGRDGTSLVFRPAAPLKSGSQGKQVVPDTRGRAARQQAKSLVQPEPVPTGSLIDVVDGDPAGSETTLVEKPNKLIDHEDPPSDPSSRSLPSLSATSTSKESTEFPPSPPRHRPASPQEPSRSTVAPVAVKKSILRITRPPEVQEPKQRAPTPPPTPPPSIPSWAKSTRTQNRPPQTGHVSLGNRSESLSTATPTPVNPPSASGGVFKPIFLDAGNGVAISDTRTIAALFAADFKEYPFPTIPGSFNEKTKQQLEVEQRKDAEGSEEGDDEAASEVPRRGQPTNHKANLDNENAAQAVVKTTKSKRTPLGDITATAINMDGDDIDVGTPVQQIRTVPRFRVFSEETGSRRFAPRRSNFAFSAQVPAFLPTISSSDASADSPLAGKSAYRLLLSYPSPRRDLPLTVTNSFSTDPLQQSVIDAWVKTEPSLQSKMRTTRFLQKLTDIVNNELSAIGGSSSSSGKPRFEVDVFGSVSWGGETGSSGDLDLVVLDHDMPQGYTPDVWRSPPGTETELVPSRRRGPVEHIRSLPQVYRLWDLAGALTRNGLRNAVAITGATTPIVKFKSIDGDGILECDLNVNDLGGWYNSSLILHYCLISPHVLRPLIYALKRWAAAFELNDPSGARGPSTMSSYCLTLMAIAYLQHRGVLPNLQADVQPLIPEQAESLEEDVVWVGWGKDQGIKAHIGFSKHPPAGWINSEPNLTAADAIRGFFSFFALDSADPEHMQYDDQILSILQGGVVPRPHARNAKAAMIASKAADMRAQGMSPEEITDVLEQDRAGRIRDEAYMGKGDKGIHPSNWSDRIIVVQDPFLWQKNCASMMSKVGKDRFIDALNHTNKLLTSDSAATLEEMMISPFPAVQTRAGRGRVGSVSSGSQRSRGSRGSMGSHRGMPRSFLPNGSDGPRFGNDFPPLRR